MNMYSKKVSVWSINLAILSLVAMTMVSGAITVVAAETDKPAQTEYTLLEPLPCLNDGTQNCKTGEMVTSVKFSSYVKYVFNLFIALAAVAAVFVIVWGGFKYVTTDSFAGKNEGRKIVWQAVQGLLLVLSSYLILRTIDPRLVDIPSTIVKPLNIEVKKTGFDFLEDMAKSAERLQIKADNQEAIQKIDGLDSEISELRERLKTYREYAGAIDESKDENVQYLLQEINKREGEKVYTARVQTLKNQYLTVDPNVQTSKQMYGTINEMFGTYENGISELRKLGQNKSVADLENQMRLYAAKTAMDVQLAMIKRSNDPTFLKGVASDVNTLTSLSSPIGYFQTKLLGTISEGNFAQAKSDAIDSVAKIYSDAANQITDPQLRTELGKYQSQTNRLIIAEPKK